MQFKVGIPTFIYGEWRNVKTTMHELSIKLQRKSNNILFIDTTNSLNPHHPVYRSETQKHLFKRIYCVRTPKPYDLWSRLSTTENFIKLRRIEVLLISSLTKFFEDAEKQEVIPLLAHIMDKVNYLTKKYNLTTIIGNSPYDDENVIIASDILFRKEKNLVIG
jgi:hypothetical protein